MDMNDYQSQAGEFARYPKTTQMDWGLVYCALKLAGEAGEFAEKIGKCIRDSNGIISAELRESLTLELGDILWYIQRASHELGYDLNNVAVKNLIKLNSRAERGMLHGSGDNR